MCDLIRNRPWYKDELNGNEKVFLSQRITEFKHTTIYSFIEEMKRQNLTL